MPSRMVSLPLVRILPASIRLVGSASLPRYMLTIRNQRQQESGDVVVAARQADDPDGRAKPARTGDQDAGSQGAPRQRPCARRVLSRGARTGAVRARLLLGRRADFLASTGRVDHRGRLFRRPYAEPYL